MTPEDHAAIVEACQAHQKAHWKQRNYRAAIFIGTDYFVKYGDEDILATEATTQRYISAYATATVPGTPRVPKVLSYFTHQDTAYLVSEYVKLSGSPLDPSSTAAALKWLADVPLPSDHIFGPLGGGPFSHPFFKNHTAPLNFSSVEALERYIEKVRSRIHFIRNIPSPKSPLPHPSLPGTHQAPQTRSGTRPLRPHRWRAVPFHASRPGPHQLWPRRVREACHYGLWPDRPLAEVICRIRYSLEPQPRPFRRVHGPGKQS